MQPKSFYYGWVIVAAATVVMTTAYALQFSYGIYLPYMAAEYGWSRAELSAPYALYLFIYSGLSLVTGRITDTRGPRLIVLAAGLLMGGGFILLGRADSLADIYIALCLVAAFGMSGAFIPLTSTVVKWFERHRARALSITGAGVGLAALVGPALATAMLTWFDWRQALLGSGLLAGLVIMTAALFLKKPDANAARETMQSTAPMIEWTRRDALSTRAYWQVLVVFSLTWSVMFMPYLHLPAHALDLGYKDGFAAGLVVALGVGSLIGRLWVGWAAERWGIVPTLLAALLSLAAFYAGFMTCTGAVCLNIGAAGLGMSSGATTILYSALLADLFGRAAIGAISGSIFAVAGFVSAVGPFLAGVVRDAGVDYSDAFLFGAAVNILAAGVLLTLKRPQRTG